MNALTVSEIDVSYGAARALRKVSLGVETGKVTCLLGRNGVGKSTLLRTIVGHLRQTHGTIALGEKDISDLKPFERARLGVAYVPQGREVFSLLTVKENLETGYAKLPSGSAHVTGRNLRAVSRARLDVGTARWRSVGRPAAATGDRARAGDAPEAAAAR